MARTPKWKLVEGVVHAMEHALAPESAVVTKNAKVPYRDNRGKRRQVDVHVLLKIEPRDIAIGIEVKDEVRPLDVTKVEQVAAKLEKLALDRRILVSVSGFADDAREDALVAGLELLTLSELAAVTWWPAAFSVPMQATHVQLVHVTVNYSDAATREGLPSLAGASVHSVYLVDRQGATASLHAHGIHHGLKMLEMPEASQLHHLSGYRAIVKMEDDVIVELRINDIAYPPPDNIVYDYRLHVGETKVEGRAYELHNHQALTWTVNIGEHAVQLTVVGREGDYPGSVSGMKIVASPAKARAKKVENPIAPTTVKPSKVAPKKAEGRKPKKGGAKEPKKG